MLFTILDWNYPHSMRFKMGGGSAAAQQVQSAPVPMPAPPVTQSNTAVVQAQQEAKAANMLKKSVRRTIYAGETGGFMPGKQGAFKPPQAPKV